MRRRAIAALAAAALAAVLAGAATAEAACPDYTFIGARGSGQKAEKGTRGMGTEVFRMAERMRAKLGRDGEVVRLLPITYEAAGVELLRPSSRQIALAGAGQLAAAAAAYYKNNFRRYIASIDEGIDLTVGAVQTVVAACPETGLIMAGYSQGAMVVHQAQLRMADRGMEDETFAILGTLLLADGDRVPGSAAKQIGSAPRDASGVRTYADGNDRRDVLDPDFTVHICDARDMVCDFNAGRITSAKVSTRTHTSYAEKRPKRLDKAVDWLHRELFSDG